MSNEAGPAAVVPALPQVYGGTIEALNHEKFGEGNLTAEIPITTEIPMTSQSATQGFGHSFPHCT